MSASVVASELGKGQSPWVQSARALLRAFYRFAGRRAAVAVAYVVTGALAEGLSLACLVPISSLIFGSSSQAGWTWRASAWFFASVHAGTPASRLLAALALVASLSLIRIVLAARRDLVIIELQLGFIEALRLKLAERLAAAEWSTVARLRHARVTQLMSGDIQRLATGLQVVLLTVVALAQLTGQMLLAFLLAPVLAAALSLFLAGGLWGLGRVLGRAHRLGHYITEAHLFLLDGTSQFLGGLKLAMGQNLESRYVSETAHTLGRIRQRQIAYARGQLRAHAVLVSLAVVGAALAILTGYAWLHVPPPILVTVLLVMARMIAPLGQVQQGARQFAEVLGVHDAVLALWGELQSAARPALAAETAPRGPIHVVQASFRHAGGQGIQNLELSIPEGEFLGLTGPSGIGKTTLLDLLAGLYAPQQGRILAGGHDISGVLSTGWRQALGYVAQDPFLFPDTIRNNLAWTCDGVGEAEMWKALALAGADELVRGLPDGLDSVVGERGALLSGGERQRIALARGLLRRPHLLLLDEATSAIDAEGERKILQRLRGLPMTVVAVAHRRQNFDLFDRVLNLVVRDGRHQVLPWPGDGAW